MPAHSPLAADHRHRGHPKPARTWGGGERIGEQVGGGQASAGWAERPACTAADSWRLHPTTGCQLTAAGRQERRAELAAIQAQLARIDIHAAADGVAVFGDPDDWLGRPVTTGERIMLLANPAKPRRERWLDFSLVGLVQLAALLYGLHSVWVARPVVLAFETDRLVIATANEVQTETLPQAPAGLQTLPWWGWLQVGTRSAKSSEEFLTSVNLGLSGISPAMRPDWWVPWADGRAGIDQRAKPVTELLARRPQDAATLQAAIAATGLPTQQLRYLPLTSRRTKDWVALLDAQARIVGHAPVDGFTAHN